MKCSQKRLGLAIALAPALAVTPAAYAQLEEIIVTAERREATLQETDIAITAFGAETLQEMGVSNILDLSGFAPSVVLHDMPGKAGAAISIRGLKNAETIATFEPKVALYMDGVIIAKNAGSLMDVLDLERVEVLRGPQGTLYGRNTVGGAINLITKKPDLDTLSGKVMATLGDFGQRDLKGHINIPLIEGKLALKASLASLNRDGYWDNTVNGEDLGDKDREAALVHIKWQPTDELSLLYSYDRSKVDEGVFPSQIVANGAGRPDLAPFVDEGWGDTRSLDGTGEFTEADVDGHSLTINWDFADNLSLVSITALRNVEVDNFADSDGSPVFVIHNFSGDEMETWTQEVRLVGNAMDERLEFVAGGFYMDEEIEETYSRPRIGIGAPWEIAKDSGFYFLSANNASATNENFAFFGEATYSVTDKLDLTAGIRYTEEDRTLARVDESGVPALGPTNVIPLGPASGTFDNVSWMTSLSYDWTEDAMTYFKVATGYASGGFNARSAPDQVQLFQQGYDEETLVMYEIGWKTQWLDNRLQINGAIFHNDYEDLQVNQLTGDGKNNLDNAGDATLGGAEIEVTAQVTDSLQIGGSYGYLDPKYDTFIDSGGNDLSNNHWAHAPENTVNAYARYEILNFQDFGDLTFRLDYQFVDDHFLLTDNSPGLVDGNTAPSYEVWNGRVTLDALQGPNGTALSVSLWGKNMLDDRWYTSGFDLTNSLGFAGKLVSAPRTWGVDLTVEF